ncbi:HAAS signaling domain-containing protein [Alkalimonas amylolytica]|uniref:Uncharacterized protein n=1 Tax=Alkalimonas amylolytica TaxID=152573 RepID=A0A1H4BRH1_ALKAM|nr:hypothetical protein [Alkalimonas amylolytica]SEA50703.1 hypothetical protein SAMN04488051_103486 [Alkalimonas amylolytica]
MDLLERYLAAVQQELPADKQQDVTRELKANILDQVDALREQTPEQSDEEHLLQVLQELGPPKQMAYQFHPPQPLIRADLIPLFRFTLFMVLGIIFLINLVQSTLLWLGHEQMGLLLLLKHMGSGFIGDATLAFTAITLGFWSMSLEQKTRCTAQQSWDPLQLPQLNHRWQRISLSDVFHDLATYLFLLILIWYPLWGEVVMSVELSMGSRFLLQAFSPLLLLGIALSLWQLKQRYWTEALLKCNLVLNALLVTAILILAWTSPFFSSVPEQLSWITAEQLERSMTISLLIIALFPGWEVIRDWQRLQKVRA